MTGLLPDFVALDVETTGLEENAAIIEIGLAFFHNGKVVDTWQTLIKPPVSIPLNITLLTGIDNDMVADAPAWDDVAPLFLDKIQGKMLAAHNHAFDREKIEYHLKEKLPNAWIDSHDLAKLFLPDLTSYKLTALAAHLEIANNDHHRALNDAVVCGLVAKAISERAARLDPFTLDEMADVLKREETLFTGPNAALEGIIRNLSTHSAQHTAEMFFADPAPETEPFTGQPLLSFHEAEQFFFDDGLLSQHKTDFEYRHPQVELLAHIKEAFEKKMHGIFEAGTGTGKTFAYLVPSLLWAFETDDRVIVSTNTINLQEQIFKQDLPFLSRALGYPFSATIMKGRSNYLCKRRFEQQCQNSEKASWNEKLFLAGLLNWQQRDDSGDREHLNLNKLEMQFWQNVCCTADTCVNNRCKYFRECFFFRNRRQCENSRLIIVNHSLLLQDMRLDGGLLPEHHKVVIDEAHHLESEAIRQFTDTVDMEMIRKRIAGIIRSKGLLQRLEQQALGCPDLVLDLADIQALIHRLQEDGEQLSDTIQAIVKEATEIPELANTGELRLTAKLREQAWWLTLKQRLDQFNDAFAHYHGVLSRLLHRVEMAAELEDVVRELSFSRDFLSEQQVWLARFSSGIDSQLVYWANSQKAGWGQNLLLYTAYIDIMPILQEKLFDRRDSVILTSATLAVSKDLSFTAENFLMEEGSYLSYITPSPFDYQTQSCIAVPTDHPDYSKVSDMTFTKNIINDLKELIPAVQGDMLVLFTSYAMLNRVYFALKSDPALAEYTILGHGQDGSRTSIIETMQDQTKTVVLGANSFWEGVDVKGSHLRTVVITKLPFAPPTMPIESAKSELLQAQGKNAFAHNSLPNAILRFRQGCGRLIRSGSDWGSVVILDNRVLTKNYGKQFINSLPVQPLIKDDMTGICQRLSNWTETRRAATPPDA